MNGAVSSAGRLADTVRLSQAEDDYSVKLTLDGDPRFWWRVEKTDGDRMLITDFTQGSQDDRVMAVALAQLIQFRKKALPLELVFHDLVPGQFDPGAHRIRLNRTAESVHLWSKEAARLLGLEVSGVEFHSERRKFQMIVTMI
jgi:hypothetical protein